MNTPEREPRGIIFILVSPDEKLLLQRRDQHCSRFPGSWCFPGGACEDGEEYLQAVIREAKEEFSAAVDPLSCRLIMRRLENRNMVYVCPVRTIEGLELQEGADMRWMSLDEVELLELGFHQSDILPVLRNFMGGDSLKDQGYTRMIP